MTRGDFRSLRNRIGRCEGRAQAIAAAARPRALALRFGLCAVAASADFRAPCQLSRPIGARGRQSPQYARRARSLPLDADGLGRRAARAPQVMAANAFADWLERGRTHQNEGRPADAIPCFRRAAREDPRSPVPHFHLGEALWQLGLTTDALQAWRTAAGLDRTFLPPRLALAEAAMTHGDFASASAVAREAVALAPQDARARATSIAASAAAGDRGAGLGRGGAIRRRSGSGACPIARGGARCRPRRQRA